MRPAEEPDLPTEVLEAVRPSDPEALALMQELDADLLRRYPAEEVHALRPEEIADFDGVFRIARLDREPVGCAALRLLGPGVGEVKRVFVRPAWRGRGIARRLLARIESDARELGCHTLRLETGVRQPEALALFESAGYVPIPCFGEYVSSPQSRCFEKRL